MGYGQNGGWVKLHGVILAASGGELHLAVHHHSARSSGDGGEGNTAA